MKKLFLGLVVVCLLVVLGLGYLGVLPILGPALAKPKDLGMTTDKQLVYQLEEKYAQKNGSGRAIVDEELSDREITSVMAVWEERDPLFPLYDVQVKFAPDGTGEASGMLKIATALELARSLGYSEAEIAQGKEYIKYVAGDLPFYVKGTGGMDANQLVIEPQQLEIGRVSVPESITAPLTKVVGQLVERRISQIGGVELEEANFRSGVFRLKGDVPDTIAY